MYCKPCTVRVRELVKFILTFVSQGFLKANDVFCIPCVLSGLFVLEFLESIFSIEIEIERALEFESSVA